ncbi:hypothetical protein BKA80DRAFT_333070 [Phyllosticta citrichinensis]
MWSWESPDEDHREGLSEADVPMLSKPIESNEATSSSHYQVYDGASDQKQAEKASGDLKRVSSTSASSNTDSASTPEVPNFRANQLPFQLGHPGWTMELSPPLNLLHSTLPDLSKWMHSDGVRDSLKQEFKDINSGQNQILSRACTSSCTRP